MDDPSPQNEIREPSEKTRQSQTIEMNRFISLSQRTEKNLLVFEELEIDKEERAVRHPDGETISLNPKALEVLEHMVARYPDLVQKEEFLREVWQGRFVGEEVLTNAVYELRQALRDSARQPRVIKTVHRKGYQLVQLPNFKAKKDPSHLPQPLKWSVAVAMMVVGFWVWYSLARSTPSGPLKNAAPTSEQANRNSEIGEKLVARRKYLEAIERFNEARKLAPRDPTISDALSNVYDILGDKDRALEFADEAIQLAQDPIERTRYERRKAQINEDLEKELALLQQGHRLSPSSPFWTSRLAWFYFEHRRDCSKSLFYYQKSMELAKALDSVTLSYWTETTIRCGNLEDAQVLWEDYSTLVPGSAAAEIRSELYWRAGDYGSAIESLLDSVRIDKSFGEGWEELALKSLALGKIEDAFSYAETFRILAETPSQLQLAFETISLIALVNGDVETASDFIRKSEQAHTPTLRTFWIEGWIALEKGDLGSFQLVMDKALGSQELNSGSLYRRAYLNLLEARDFLHKSEPRKALRALDPQHVRITLPPGFVECERRYVAELGGLEGLPALTEKPQHGHCLQWAKHAWSHRTEPKLNPPT